MAYLAGVLIVRHDNKISNLQSFPTSGIAPLPEFIEDIYFKRFGKEKPDKIVTIREIMKGKEQQKQQPVN